MEQNQAEISTIRAQIESLQQERAALTVDVVSPKNDSPEAITEAYRRHARESAQLSAEVKGIDDAIAALEAQIVQKQNQSGQLPQQSLAEQVAAGRKKAKVHAEKINQLAAELAEELRALKSVANELSPSYWQVYYKPFITGFKTISVPHVRSDEDVWTIVNRIV